MAAVRSEWLLPLPKGLTPLDAAKIGTAGYTAMLCVNALQAGTVFLLQNSHFEKIFHLPGGIKPADGEVVVTGATGGVGSISVALLAELGFKVNPKLKNNHWNRK